VLGVLEVLEAPEVVEAPEVLEVLDVPEVPEVLDAGVELLSLEEPLFSDAAGVPAFSAAAFLPPSDFGALPLSPFG